MLQWYLINCEMSVINNELEEILFYVYFIIKIFIIDVNILIKNDY